MIRNTGWSGTAGKDIMPNNTLGWQGSKRQGMTGKLNGNQKNRMVFHEVFYKDIRQRAALFGEEAREEREKLPKPEKENWQEGKEKTESVMIVKPDGTRVLVITMCCGGMQRTISLKLSDPAEFPGDESRTAAEEGGAGEVSDMAAKETEAL